MVQHFSGLAIIPRWVNMKTKKFPLNAEHAFLQVELHIRSLQCLLEFLQVFHVLVARIQLQDYVIYVNLHVPVDHPFKDLVHQPLVSGPNILEAKRHNLVVVVCSVHHTSGLLLISWMHAYLVVAKVCIQEAMDIMASCPILQPVDAGERVRVLRARLVEVGVVNTHPPLVVSLGDHDYIGQPGSVVGLSYKADRQKLMSLLPRCKPLLLPKLALFLSHWSHLLVNRKLVSENIQAHPRHIRCCPGKKIYILHQCLVDHLCLCCRYLCFHTGGVILVEQRYSTYGDGKAGRTCPHDPPSAGKNRRVG